MPDHDSIAAIQRQQLATQRALDEAMRSKRSGAGSAGGAATGEGVNGTPPPHEQGGAPPETPVAAAPTSRLHGEDADRENLPARGPGRPAGSKNRASEELRALFTQDGTKLPILIARDSVLRKTVPDLAAEWGIKKSEAAKLWVSVLVATFPYLHQRLPQLVEGSGDTATFAIIGLSQNVANAVNSGGHLSAGSILNGDFEPIPDAEIISGGAGDPDG